MFHCRCVQKQQVAKTITSGLKPLIPFCAMNSNATGAHVSTPTQTPVEMLRELLADPTNPEVVNRLVAPDVTYVSLNYDNPDLHKLMPWAGTYQGREAIISTFVRVAEYWKELKFEIEAIFGDRENVAVRGRGTWTSRILGKTIVGPYAVFAKVTNGKITYMQFMEDTFATSSTFRSAGTWKFESNPNGEKVEVGTEEA